MKKLAIGIMSGTSLDGIDVSLASIEGQQENTQLAMIYSNTFSYDEELLHSVKKAIQNKSTSMELCQLNVDLAHAYSKCVFALCEEANISIEDIDFIASHGQTIYHITKEESKHPASLQLGDGSVISNLTNTTVISNFRQADIAKGGSGAPLVPFADYVLFQDIEKTRCMQNIGGVSNVTVLKKNGTKEEVYAFDNGPGNMMIDEAMNVLFQQKYDKDGLTASKGKCIKEMFQECIIHPYYDIIPPKSTGREDFGTNYTNQLLEKYSDKKKEDIIATLTHVTAYAIAKSYQDFIITNNPIDEVIVSGGGAHNKELMRLIRYYLKSENVYTLDEFGFSSDYKEALAFIILGNETLHGNPSNVLGATGAKEYAVLGQISKVWKKV